MSDIFNNALSQMRSVLSTISLDGQAVVDATAGNGKDTLFLAKAVGEKGTVYAFDIQEEALVNTKTLLDGENITWYQLIHDSHANIDKYDIAQPQAVVFNLGYLPGGDHTVITQPQTTLLAIKKSLSILKIGGILTTVIYTGHEGGKAEENLLNDYFNSLPRAFDVLKISLLNRSNNPPYLIAVRKLREVQYEV